MSVNESRGVTYLDSSSIAFRIFLVELVVNTIRIVLHMAGKSKR